MSEWYYACGGRQQGPVTFDQLAQIARSGGLDPAKDLVWTTTMKDWTPAGQVEGLFNGAAAPAVDPVSRPADPLNPYAAPQSAAEPVPANGLPGLPEIVPGSEPISVSACVKRGFDLTVRHFGMILLVGLTYIGVTIAASLVLGALDSALGLGHSKSQTVWQPPAAESGGDSPTTVFRTTSSKTASPLNTFLSQLLSIFLSLGAVRVGLNLVSGREVSVAMLFGEARKLLPAVVASLLFGLMVGVGLLLLIVPGIYLALRYGQFLTAMVDRNLGILGSFSYSSSITTNNRLNLFLLALMAVAIAIAGLLALVVGLIFAYPVIWLSWLVAYRWMQYGSRAAIDHPGTVTPMLAGA